MNATGSCAKTALEPACAHRLSHRRVLRRCCDYNGAYRNEWP